MVFVHLVTLELSKRKIQNFPVFTLISFLSRYENPNFIPPEETEIDGEKIVTNKHPFDSVGPDKTENFEDLTNQNLIPLFSAQDKRWLSYDDVANGCLCFYNNLEIKAEDNVKFDIALRLWPVHRKSAEKFRLEYISVPGRNKELFRDPNFNFGTEPNQKESLKDRNNRIELKEFLRCCYHGNDELDREAMWFKTLKPLRLSDKHQNYYKMFLKLVSLLKWMKQLYFNAGMKYATEYLRILSNASLFGALLGLFWASYGALLELFLL